MNTAPARPTTSAPPTARPAPHGGRRLLGLLLILFALPFGLAAGLYLSDWRPDRGANYGELLPGAAPLPLSRLQSGAGPSPPALAGRWLLLVVSSGDCAAPCRRHLELTRRLHVALNKNMPRLQRLLLTTGHAPADALHAAGPQLVIARSDDAGWRALVASLPDGDSRVYLLDPAGRPVLRFPAELDGREALRDLERLLKLSWIG